MDRPVHLQRLREEEFDVVVIGGGITGAAAARDAARRGFHTALVEARDFAWGTSSRSSRLVHGGLRYLENLELDLVFDASRERGTLLRIAPHLVRPLQFLFPLWEDGRVGRMKLDAGMWLYDALSLFRNVERHQMLDSGEVREVEPGLRDEGLLGGARYFDAQVDDARLVLDTVLGAAEAGAAVANRVRAVDVERLSGAVSGVRVRAEDGEEWTVSTRLALNATGAWAERTVEMAGRSWQRGLRPTRGTHIHVDRDRLGHEGALIFESPLDHRIMFVLPWREDLTMIGTTDEDHEGDPGDVVPTAREVAYLLESTNRIFPGAGLGPGDVISAWAGLRPLVAGEEAAESEEDVSRDFVVTEGPPGMLTIAGGKLTSHRSMAEELVDRAEEFLAAAFHREARRPCDTHRAPLPGGEFEELEALEAELEERAASQRLPDPTVRRLAAAYGTRAHRVLDLVDRRQGLREPLLGGHPYLAAEVVHAARREMALHVPDVLFRRTHLGWETREMEEAARRTARLMAGERGWDEGRREEEVERALDVRRRDEAFREELEATWEG